MSLELFPGGLVPTRLRASSPSTATAASTASEVVAATATSLLTLLPACWVTTGLYLMVSFTETVANGLSKHLCQFSRWRNGDLAALEELDPVIDSQDMFTLLLQIFLLPRGRTAKAAVIGV